MRSVVAVAVLALALLATAGPAAAIDNGTLGIRPSNESDFFHLSLYPGAATDATAIVSNHTDTPVTLLTYPVDGQSSPQGTFALAAQTDPRTGIGAWVRLDTAQITVPANSDLKVPFRLSVPANTPPGDYAGGLIIQSPPVEGETSIVGGDTAVRLDVIQRQGVRIYLNVAGTALKSLELGDLSWKQTGDTVTFTLPVRNTGNSILHPTATLDLSGWIGANTNLNFDTPESILPGENLDLKARLLKAPPIQAGTADATITSEAGTDHAQASIVYAPWLLLGVGLFLLAVVVYGLWRAARFVRRARRAIAQVARAGPDNHAPTTAILPSGRARHRDA
ncbi:DUF916 domain-containing protein [Cryobacterium tagatosivorans]|uniref:DUF916 domain-containing protein n=1 Tax=Cryobacterium tagatosivorans TaxID=1259199 RepID=A0A4R8UKV0_9MICO|nr:DUF916 domain-containing protein [Cryobacterium tagatosivorans]